MAHAEPKPNATRTSAKPGDRWARSSPRGAALFLVGVSLLLALPPLLNDVQVSVRAASALLAMASTGLLWRWQASGSRRALVGAAIGLSSQFGAAVFAITHTSDPAPFALLQATGLVLYVATSVACLLDWTDLVSRTSAMLLAGVLAASILSAEGFLALTRNSRPDFYADLPEWTLTLDPHPLLGERYRAHSEMRSYYADNPRGYFKQTDPRELDWKLTTDAPSSARLELHADTTTLRVAIESATPEPVWAIRLTKPNLVIARGTQYVLSFRARAARPRPLVVALVQAHEPWLGLGLHDQVSVSTDWETYRRAFAGEATDSNAQIQFSLNGNDAPVELADIELRDVSGPEEQSLAVSQDSSHPRVDGRLVEPPPAPRRWYMDYRLNELGCRGPDFPVPRPPSSSRRILVLGDSFTLGAGVREEDTFAHQLERTLVNEAGADVEVINCGVGGYGVRKQRLFYEEFARRYAPDFVLQVISFDDGIHFLDDIWARQQADRAPRWPASVFRSWSLVQEHRRRQRHLYPLPNPIASADEVRKLGEVLRAEGIPLGVVLLRSGPADVWNRYAASLRSELNGTLAPVLDLTPAFGEHRYLERLQVSATDAHLNEIAHRIVAQRLLDFVQRRQTTKQ